MAKRCESRILVAMIAAFCLSSAATAGSASLGGAPKNGTRFNDVWTNWSAVNRGSLDAELVGASAKGLRNPVGESSAHLKAGSPELGAHVGEIVAAGDCSEGERLARAAGDFPLLAAVRDYCKAKPDK